ncbi:MAG: sigma-70 family RNA polymerase sigma factor [Actinobacteria bacterium]|nr:sigma-70 family RNA polymerase sigma factor [Actinomycetota bacterium]
MVWTVAELGAFYTEHRSELLAHAARVLRDSAKAEEITQDALIKFMLAAPELESSEHALSYLHRTIENLCIDLFRLEGRRPNLVLLDDATAEVEAIWQDNGDHSAVLSAAEDAAIIREALALLSPAERAALVMWEVEGRSTEEIAAELGIKESAVRHTVSRARASLRRILSELIIDEERGLTALDLLSTTYKKASDVAKKSSKVALSLVMILVGFLGYNSLTGDNGSLVVKPNTEIASGPVAGSTGNKATEEEVTPSTAPSAANPSKTATKPSLSSATKAAVVNPSSFASPSKAPANVPQKPVATPKEDTDGLVNGFAIKSARLSYPGLDKDGVPTGFTITDSSNAIGTLFVGKDAPILTDSGIVLKNRVLTTDGGPNIMITQTITVDGTGTHVDVYPVAGINGFWTALNIGSTSVTSERLADGNHLMTVTMLINSAVSSDYLLATNGKGYDLSSAPKAITARILLTSGKTQILAEAISVSDTRKGAIT